MPKYKIVPSHENEPLEDGGVATFTPCSPYVADCFVVYEDGALMEWYDTEAEAKQSVKDAQEWGR